MHLPQLSKTNKILLVLLVASFVVCTILIKAMGVPLMGLLGLSLAGLKNFFIFQFITFPFVNSSLMEVVFTGLLLWFLGSDLENSWGARKYIAYLVMTLIFTGVTFILIALVLGQQNAPLHGMGIFSSAMCVSYAVMYPDRVFQFFMLIPIKAKYFCMILAFMSLYSGIFSPSGALAFGSLASMGFGFIFSKYLARKNFDSFFPSNKKMSSSRTKNSHLRIVKDENDNDKPPRYWQ